MVFGNNKMTPKENKQHKLKLIALILMCDFILYKKNPPKDFKEVFFREMETSYWMLQLSLIQSQPIPKQPKGSISFSGEYKKEIIINNA